MIIEIIDIETTGLDPERCQMTEFACITWDSVTDTELGRFERKIWHPEYYIKAESPQVALWLLANAKDSVNGVLLKEFAIDFREYVGGKEPIILAGKNVEKLDRRFLERIPGVPSIDHRSLDIGSLFVRRTDQRIPGLADCCARAGVPFDPSRAHGAMYDCEINLALLRSIYVEQK